MRANAVNLATFTNALCHRNATPLNKVKMGQCLGGGLLSLSLSLSLLALFGILTFLNTLFLGFLRLSLRAVFAKTAWQSINLALFLLFGLPRSLCSLAMTARHKFKFFTQNLRHFVNSTHFINLTQILSPTQGFFIFLPQVFAQCKLIKNFLQGGHCV